MWPIKLGCERLCSPWRGPQSRIGQSFRKVVRSTSQEVYVAWRFIWSGWFHYQKVWKRSLVTSSYISKCRHGSPSNCDGLTTASTRYMLRCWQILDICVNGWDPKLLARIARYIHDGPVCYSLHDMCNDISDLVNSVLHRLHENGSRRQRDLVRNTQPLEVMLGLSGCSCLSHVVARWVTRLTLTDTKCQVWITLNTGNCAWHKAVVILSGEATNYRTLRL